MLQDFKSEIKLFLIVAASAVVLVVAGIFLLQAGLGPSSLPLAPQNPPAAPSPKPRSPTATEGYRFGDFPAEEVYTGPVAPVDFRANPAAEEFFTVITNGVAEGPNFAAHYRVATWGCGSPCNNSAIVDVKTGEIISFPVGGKSHFGADYRIDSNLLILNPAEQQVMISSGTERYFVLENDQLRELFSSQPVNVKGFNAKIVGSYTSPGESSKVALGSRVVYLTDISQGLLVIDVIDPTNPKLLQSFKIEGGGAYAVSETVDYVLAGGYGNQKIAIFEVSDKGSLRPFKEFNAKRSVQEAASFGVVNLLAIDGPEFEVYEALTGESHIVSGTPGGHILDFAVTESSGPLYLPVLLAAQGERGMALFDISASTFYPGLHEVLDLDGYTYAVDGGDRKGYTYALSGNELVVLCIGSLGEMKAFWQFTKIALDGNGADLDVANGIAAIAMWDKGVTFIDVSTPENPRILGTVDTPGRARDVELQYAYDAYYAYVADDRDDLQIIEVRR